MLSWSWNVICSAVEVFKEAAFDLLDGTSLLKSQLKKCNDNKYNDTIICLEEEMMNYSCSNIEALNEIISNKSKKINSNPKCQCANIDGSLRCMCTTSKAELAFL